MRWHVLARFGELVSRPGEGPAITGFSLTGFPSAAGSDLLLLILASALSHWSWGATKERCFQSGTSGGERNEGLSQQEWVCHKDLNNSAGLIHHGAG